MEKVSNFTGEQSIYMPGGVKDIEDTVVMSDSYSLSGRESTLIEGFDFEMKPPDESYYQEQVKKYKMQLRKSLLVRQSMPSFDEKKVEQKVEMHCERR